MIAQSTIQASPAAIYFALTDPTTLAQWLCDRAHVTKRVGGGWLLSWHNGDLVSGEFIALEPDKHLTLMWLNKSETTPTQVDITLTPAGESTTVQVQATGDEWSSRLQALKSLLETGCDWRLMRRPLLGITPEPLTPQLAAKIGVPVTEGTYIQGVADNLGARAAGLRTGDVLVMLGGSVVKDYESMIAALAPYAGGDIVAIEFYRGSEKHSTDMLLSKRPMPAIPASAAELMAVLQAAHAELDAELDALLNGVSEAITAQHPAPEEWSVNDNLAHLIWTERFNQMWMWGMVGGEDTIPWPDNNPLHLVGILAAFPTTTALIAELKRSELQTAATIGALPADFIQHRKPTYTTLARSLLDIPSHTRDHFGQIRRALAAVTA